jgi:hypothetical protein
MYFYKSLSVIFSSKKSQTSSKEMPLGSKHAGLGAFLLLAHWHYIIQRCKTKRTTCLAPLFVATSSMYKPFAMPSIICSW